MSAERFVLAAGAYHLALGVFHLAFWKLFHWREELPKLSTINRGVLQVLNVMLSYVFFAVALGQLFHAESWTTSIFGRVALALMAGFWLLRAALQPLFWPRTTLGWGICGGFLFGAALHFAALT
ncbi:MAG: hypothetical protein C0518_07770 [Opitutus sp.]|nr:hypothetical protein [Opitutus sp.]